MFDFDIFMPVRVVSGNNALLNNSALLKTLGTKALIVTGAASARKSGALGDLETALSKEGIDYRVFDGIGQNPLISSCRAAGEQARSMGADFIIGVGGGSPLDAAKAVAIYAANKDLTPEDIYRRVYNNEPLPVALVGTTAGTGSEVTAVSVLTVDSTGRKKSISGPDCYAEIAFADPKYTYSVPYDITVSTALDAFCHAAEAWFTPRCTGVNKLYASAGLKILWEEIKAFEKDTLPSDAARDNLYAGSLYAGLAINLCGTAFPHPLGYVLTENYGVPHGKACAMFLPAFLERARRFEKEKSREMRDITGSDFEEVSAAAIELTALPDIRISANEAKEYAQRWAEQVPKNFVNSPGGMTAEEAQVILEQLNR